MEDDLGGPINEKDFELWTPCILTSENTLVMESIIQIIDKSKSKWRSSSSHYSEDSDKLSEVSICSVNSGEAVHRKHKERHRSSKSEGNTSHSKTLLHPKDLCTSCNLPILYSQSNLQGNDKFLTPLYHSSPIKRSGNSKPPKLRNMDSGIGLDFSDEESVSCDRPNTCEVNCDNDNTKDNQSANSSELDIFSDSAFEEMSVVEYCKCDAKTDHNQSWEENDCPVQLTGETNVLETGSNSGKTSNSVHSITENSCQSPHSLSTIENIESAIPTTSTPKTNQSVWSSCAGVDAGQSNHGNSTKTGKKS